MLSTNPSDDYEELLEVIKTGAAAYLKTRDSTTKALADTIERVCNGEYPINDCVWSKPEAALLVLRQFQYLTTFGKTFEETISPLSPREKQILTYIADGNSNKQISVIFGVSEQTIKNHVSAILRKLNANDRAHAVYIAISKGLVPGKTYSYLN
jgi:DNA-binding NarL/FixJ family response regulator